MNSKTQTPRSVSSMAELRARAQQRDDQLLPASGGPKLQFIPFCKIRPFMRHPFRLYIGERLEDMVESIRQNGILTPPLVRRMEDGPDFDYEMLSGHNRMNAGQLAGLDGALCVVKEHLSDYDAMTYVIETNLMQRSFAELLSSEKAAVLALRYSEMFSQGKRNDILQELRELEGDATCGTEFHKLNSRDALGADYAMTGRQIAKYLRVHSLIDPLKLRIDNREFSLVTASKLSYLSTAAQEQVEQILTKKHYNVNVLKIDALRAADQAGPLAIDQTFQILMDAEAKKAAPTAVKIQMKTYQKFFPPGTPAKEVEEIIEKALALYFQHQGGKESA